MRIKGSKIFERKFAKTVSVLQKKNCFEHLCMQNIINAAISARPCVRLYAEVKKPCTRIAQYAKATFAGSVYTAVYIFFYFFSIFFKIGKVFKPIKV